MSGLLLIRLSAFCPFNVRGICSLLFNFNGEDAMPLDTPLIPLPDNDEALIPSRQLPAYIGIAAQTLARWRYEGKGPEYLKVGRKVCYRVAIVRRWLEKQQRSNTAQST